MFSLKKAEFEPHVGDTVRINFQGSHITILSQSYFAYFFLNSPIIRNDLNCKIMLLNERFRLSREVKPWIIPTSHKYTQKNTSTNCPQPRVFYFIDRDAPYFPHFEMLERGYFLRWFTYCFCCCHPNLIGTCCRT